MSCFRKLSKSEPWSLKKKKIYKTRKASKIAWNISLPRSYPVLWCWLGWGGGRGGEVGQCWEWFPHPRKIGKGEEKKKSEEMAVSFRLSSQVTHPAVVRSWARAPQGLGECVQPAVWEQITQGLAGSSSPAGVSFSHQWAAPEQFCGPVSLSEEQKCFSLTSSRHSCEV